MDKIKYLMKLSLERFTRAGMAMIILFLATGWGTTVVLDRKDRIDAAAKEEIRREKDAQKIIELYNIILERGDERYKLIESSIINAHQAIKVIEHTLEKFKK